MDLVAFFITLDIENVNICNCSITDLHERLAEVSFLMCESYLEVLPVEHY